MIGTMLETKEIQLVALQAEISAYEERCDKFEVKLEEVSKQKTELVVYSAKKKEELQCELEVVRKEKLEYEEKCNKLGKQSSHFEEKSKELGKEAEQLKGKN